jgi:hypothetical protein
MRILLSGAIALISYSSFGFTFQCDPAWSDGVNIINLPSQYSISRDGSEVVLIEAANGGVIQTRMTKVAQYPDGSKYTAGNFTAIFIAESSGGVIGTRIQLLNAFNQTLLSTTCR